jgi:hypothetical protein
VINAITFPDAVALHDGMCEQLMFGKVKDEHYDWVHGTEVGLHNVALAAESFNWDYDLKSLWLAKSRWNMMVRQYIDPDALEAWRAIVADRLLGRGRGIATLRTRMVQGRGTGRNVRRRWGSCMLNLSFRSNPIPTVSLHSRTTYFGYLAAMDLTVAHAFAQEAGAITGIPVEEMQFVWTLDLAQFHGFRSLAWPLMDEDTRNQMYTDLPARLDRGRWAPGYRKALDGLYRIDKCDQANKPYGDEKFSSFNRTRRRLHTEAFGLEFAQQFAGGEKNIGPFPELPPLWAHDLDFSILGSGTAGDYEQDEDDEEDE